MADVITVNGEVFKQIGVTALRTPTGEFLPSQPVYIKVAEKKINPETNMTQHEESTLSGVAKLFAEKFAQYVDGCKAIGIDPGI